MFTCSSAAEPLTVTIIKLYKKVLRVSVFILSQKKNVKTLTLRSTLLLTINGK